jgi:hypothetical protein
VTSCVVNWGQGGREFVATTPGQQGLQMIVDILRQVQKPLMFESIIAQASLTKHGKLPVTKGSLLRLLNDACESDTNMIFTRTASTAPKRNQNIIYEYGLANW